MSDTTYSRPSRPMRGRGEGRWQLAAAGLGLLFGYLCYTWSPLMAAGAAAAVGLLLLCVAYPFVGVLATLALTVALEQFGIITNSEVKLNPFSLMIGQYYFMSLHAFTGIGPLRFSFQEAMLVVSGLSWVVRQMRAGTLRWRGGALMLPLAVLIGAMLLALTRGLATGGDLRMALAETRAMFLLALTYVLAAHMTEGRWHVRTMMWTVIGAIIFRALMAWWHAGVTLHFHLSRVDTVTTHLDGLLFAFLIVFWMALRLYRAEPRQRAALGVMFLFLLGALILSKRRAAIMALVIAVPYLLMLLDWRRQRRVVIAGVAACVPLLLYVAAFWNSHGPLAMPVRLVKSVAETGTEGRHASSNYYRLIENRNLTADIRDYPLLGKGFGQPYRVRWTGYDRPPIEGDLPDLGYDVWRYIPHNQILWIWVKAGLLGFAALWFFVLVALAHGTHLARTLQTPYFRAIAASVTLLVCMHLFFSYFDGDLVGVRGMPLVGIMLGMMTRLRAIERETAG